MAIGREHRPPSSSLRDDVDRAISVLLVACAMASCARARSCDGSGDESEEREEQDLLRDHYGRASIEIVGAGRVHTSIDAFDCASDGSTAAGRCGPTLVRFKELAPATMEAIAAPSWRFDHWESSTSAPDASVRLPPGPMPDGRLYLNGFGYADTGEVETVRAVFVRASGDE
jgi:hypothetical protein